MQIFSLAFTRMPWGFHAQNQTHILMLQKCLLFVLLTFGIAPKVHAQYPKERLAAIDAYCKGLENFGLSGSLLIGSSKEILFEGTYGNPAPYKGTNPVYLIGSLSKQFTATAILLLEQSGKLHTEDSISLYLDWLPEDKRQITIHQLLTHTAGLQDDYWDQHPTLTEQAYLSMMLDHPLKSTPGERYSYTNIGYHVLAKIIESISGEKYEAFLSRRLWQPSGLIHTGFHLVNWDSAQIARYTDWTTRGSEAYLNNPLNRPVYLQPEGSGGLLSTPQDMFRWYQVLFHSENLLKERSRNKLLKAELNNYAYGWEVYFNKNGRRIVEHGGYDSWVGVVTGLYNYVDEDLVIIYLGNTHMGGLLQKQQIISGVESILLGGELRLPPSTYVQDEVPIFSTVQGSYQKEGKTIQIDKGRKTGQIRLRTAEKSIVRQLLLPVDPKAPELEDVQLNYIIEQLDAGELEKLREHLFYQSSFEAVKQRYLQIWQQLEAAYGDFRKAGILYLLPGHYEGKFELQYILRLQFENGEFFARAFRNHLGKFHLQPLELPSELEVFLVPDGHNEYIFWNIKTGLSTRLHVESGRLRLNGDITQFYMKSK